MLSMICTECDALDAADCAVRDRRTSLFWQDGLTLELETFLNAQEQARREAISDHRIAKHKRDERYY
jgi:hypothetical protein